jgi:hypothetical protein
MANVPQPQLSRLLGTLLTEDSPLGKFIGGTLTDEARMAEMDQQPPIQILPDVNVIKIGAQSMMDPRTGGNLPGARRDCAEFAPA